MSTENTAAPTPHGNTRIESQHPHEWIWISIAALLWLGCLVAVGIWIFSNIPGLSGNTKTIIVGTIAAFSLPLLRAAYVLLKHYKFRGAVFQLAQPTGVVGGPLRGIVYLPVNLIPEDGFRITLKCMKAIEAVDEHTIRGKRRTIHRTVNETVWKDTIVLAREMLASDHTRSAIPILFAIPYDAPQSNDAKEDKVSWLLELDADVPGIDLQESFEIPVRRTPESKPGFVLDERPLKPYLPTLEEIAAKRKDLHSAAADAGIRITPLGVDGVRFHFRAARTWSAPVTGALLAIFPTTVAIVFHLPAALIPIGDTTPEFLFKIFVLSKIQFIAYAATAVALLLWSGAAWHLLSADTVDIANRQVRHTHRILGVKFRRRCEATSVARIFARPGSKADVQYFEILLQVKYGNGRVLAQNVPGPDLAERLCDAMNTSISGNASS